MISFIIRGVLLVGTGLASWKGWELLGIGKKDDSLFVTVPIGQPVPPNYQSPNPFNPSNLLSLALVLFAVSFAFKSLKPLLK
jgi:hypothetical protein